jgi:gamma-glutamylcysteine synthetase
MGICAKWSVEDRQQLNAMAQTLNLSYEVAGQTLRAWCEQFLSFALEGLADNREKQFLALFAEEFLSVGPFSLSTQASFEKSGKSVEQFLKDRWEEQKDLLKEITKP